MKKILVLLLLAALLLACVPALAASYVPGTYTESADGLYGPVTLAVTTTENAIAAIKVVSQGETAGLGDVAIEKVVADMIAANSADVDSVTNATISSEAAKAAVAAALARAEKG